MAAIEPLDMVFRLKFEAAIQDHVAKKATSRRAKAEARKAAADLREQALKLEKTRAQSQEPGDLGDPLAI